MGRRASAATLVEHGVFSKAHRAAAGAQQRGKPSSCLFSSHGILWNKWTRKLKSPKHQPHTMLWGQSQPSLYFPSLFWALIACKTWAASSSVISPYQEIQMKLHSHRRLLEVYRSPACLYKRCIYFFSSIFFFFFSRRGSATWLGLVCSTPPCSRVPQVGHFVTRAREQVMVLVRQAGNI